MAVLDRVPPHSEEAEVGVLGSMLLDKGAIGEVLQILKADDFYSPAHSVIFQSLLTLYDQNQAIDIILVSEELKRRGMLEKVGGIDGLADLMESVPTAANAEYYAKAVQEKAIRRKLIAEASEILKEAYENSESVEELLDGAERRVFRITEGYGNEEPNHIKEILTPVFNRIDEIHGREGRLTGLATGYYRLDDLLCGLQRSELVVMASRPSIGKSSLALCIIHNVAVHEKKAVALFTLEMSKEQVAQNMLCARARVNAHQVRRGLLPEGESTKLAEAAGALYEADIIIDDSTSLTPLQLRAKARRMKAEHDIELVVVDYMQLMYVARSEGRQQEIAEISRSLKGLARELKVPVLAISQLNRAPELRESHKPRLADLRESGAIEQDADVVLLLHRDDYYEEHSNPGRAELRIAKQRNGPVGSVMLTFLKEYMRFESYADEGL